MSDENPNYPEPIPPAGAEPVPPAQLPVPPAGAQPVPPAHLPVPPADPAHYQPIQDPVPPAGAQPVPPAQMPVPPAEPQQPVYDPPQPHDVGSQTVQLESMATPTDTPNPMIPPINQGPAPIQQAAAGAAAGAGAARSRSQSGRRKSAKKKSVRKKTAARGATRPGAQRKPLQTYDSGISFMSILMALLGVAMLVGSVVALLPRSLTHIDGYPSDSMNNKEPKNLLAEGQKILKTRTEDATFTEQEVNDYINFRLNGLQKGAFGGFMKVKGIYVELRKNEAEIFVERSLPIFGSTTMSSVVKSHYNEIKHQQSWKLGGGSIGKIPMKDRSLQPILNSFLRMSKVGAAELEVMNYMADVKIQDGKIILDSAL